MKKLFGLILSATVVCMLFQSCNDDKFVDNGSSEINDGKCYMTLRFNVKRLHSDKDATRTFEPTYGDEDFERTITDFRIFLVKQNDDDAPVVELKDIEMLNSYTTKPFEIKSAYKHGYQLYVVANLGGSFNLDLSSAKAFRGTYSLVTKGACENLWQQNHFLMVNVNNEASDFANYTHVYQKWEDGYDLEHTDATPNGGVPVEIDDNTSYTYDNPYCVKVNLERVAAKIVVDCSAEDYDFTSYYTCQFHDVHVEGVALINGANCFNLVQQWQIACYQGGEYFAYEWLKEQNYGDITVPDGAPFGYPFLWAVTPGGDISTTPSQIYYNQISDFTDFDNKALKDGALEKFQSLDANKKATIYCLENSSPLYLDFFNDFTKGVTPVEKYDEGQDFLKTGMRNRATGVLFRVRAKIKVDSHTTDGLTPDPDKGTWTKSKTRASSGDEYRTFYCYKETLTPYLSQLLNDYPELSNKGISSTSTVKQMRDAGMKVYEDGYMYYIHWITDQNYQYFWNYMDSNDEAWPFNYLSVLRNTRYEVNVTSVYDIGMDLPGRQVNRYGIVVEGNDYLLFPVKNPVNDEDMKEEWLQKLKNKAI